MVLLCLADLSPLEHFVDCRSCKAFAFHRIASRLIGMKDTHSVKEFTDRYVFEVIAG